MSFEYFKAENHALTYSQFRPCPPKELIEKIVGFASEKVCKIKNIFPIFYLELKAEDKTSERAINGLQSATGQSELSVPKERNCDWLLENMAGFQFKK